MPLTLQQSCLALCDVSKTILPLFSAATLAFSLTACYHKPDDTSKAAFQTELIKDENQSGLNIYRPRSLVNAFYDTQIIIDDAEPVNIKSAQLYQLKLSPGKHHIRLISAENFVGKQAIDLELEAKQTYFLRIGTSLKIDSDGEGDYTPYKRSFELQPVIEQSAIAQINDCCFKDRHSRIAIAEKADSVKTEVNEEAEFSIEKTSNPFSH